MKTRSKDLNLCKNQDLFAPIYKNRYVLKNMKEIKKKVISFYERCRYGVSRQDSWDFDHYLTTVLENGLKYLKDAGNSYPGYCTYEEWQKKLEYMIKLSEIANRYEDEMTLASFDKYIECCNEYGEKSEETEKAKKEWLLDEKEADDLKYDSINKLIKELEKYIYDLWD